MKKGKWNYTEEIEYTVLLVKLLPVEKPPMHWQNAFAGEERQVVKITHGDYSFYIDNEDGSGLHKISRGGGPDSYSAHIEGFDIIRDLPEQEWNQWDIEKHDEFRKKSDAWAAKHFPEEHKKVQALKTGLAALKKDPVSAINAMGCNINLPVREKITGGNEFDKATGNIYECSGKLIGKSVNGKITWLKK